MNITADPFDQDEENVIPPALTEKEIVRWPSGEHCTDYVAAEVPVALVYNGISHPFSKGVIPESHDGLFYFAQNIF